MNNNNVINQAPYLRVQRTFPQDNDKELVVQLDKSYIDTANAINVRTIGIFPTNKPAVTGESWFLTAKKQQSLRQIFTFTTQITIPHGIQFFAEIMFPRIFGGFTDNTKWYPLPWVDVTNITNQITVNVDKTNINIIKGATAPTIISGIIILEWIVQP